LKEKLTVEEKKILEVRRKDTMRLSSLNTDIMGGWIDDDYDNELL